MLDNIRIEEAKSSVNSYISEGLLEKGRFQQIIFDTYMRNHRESLEVAKELHKQKLSSLWVIVTSYYSMFYLANAVLYRLGYKTGHRIAHKVTSDALIVFVRDKLKDVLLESYEIAAEEALSMSDSYLQSFDHERVKRSIIQYESTEEIKLSKAETSLKRAKEFSIELENVLDSL